MANLLIYLEYFLSLLVFIILTRILDFTPVEYRQLEKLTAIEKKIDKLIENYE